MNVISIVLGVSGVYLLLTLGLYTDLRDWMKEGCLAVGIALCIAAIFVHAVSEGMIR